MVFEFIPPELEPWLWAGGIMGVIGWMTHMSRCLRQQRKRTWRIERAFILSLKLQVRVTKQAHPNDKEVLEDVLDIEKFVNVVLQPESDSDSEDFSFMSK